MEEIRTLLSCREQIALALMPHVMHLRSVTPYNTTMRDMSFNLDDHGAAVCRDAFDLADAFIWTSNNTKPPTP
jgi:hypothetical protein